MNTLAACVDTPVAKALGWTLFHFLWEGAAIAALLLVALHVLRPAAARVRYGLACAALLAMPLAFAITLGVSLPAQPARFAVHPNALLPGEWAAAPAGSAAPPPVELADRLAWAAPFWLAGVVGIFLFRCAGWMAAQRLRRVVLLESCLAEAPGGRTPGWRTPRGRYYITDGPPNEIEDYTQTADPHQVWKYRWAESVKGELSIWFGKDGFRSVFANGGYSFVMRRSRFR